MYIKQVIIEGFKSYKDLQRVDPFNPKINVVVGPNGSGKSNFFKAISFVIGDIFQQTTKDDRTEYLHESGGNQCLSAYVELVLDNSDHRFNLDVSEVRIRRTVSTKKDEYRVNGTVYTKTELQAVLESAGFARDNPYYVVQQGKIMQMAEMHDHQRLELLKEIGGAKQYEEKRNESVKKLRQIEQQLQQINDVAQAIENDIQDKESDRQELLEYLELNKQRKCLEYVVLEREQQAQENKLAKAFEEEKSLEQNESMWQGVNEELEGRLEGIEEARAGLVPRLDQAKSDEKAGLGVKESVLREVTRLELDVKECQRSIQTLGVDKENAARDLSTNRRKLDEATQNHAAAAQELQNMSVREYELGESIQELEAEQQRLFLKQGEGEQFTSVTARDDFIRGEVGKLRETLAQQKDSVVVKERFLEETAGQLREIEGKIEERSRFLADVDARVSLTQQSVNQRRNERDAVFQQKKDLWQQQQDVDDQLKGVRDELGAKVHKLKKSVNQDIYRATQSVEKIVMDYKIAGCYGTIVDLITCPDRVSLAVSAAATNQIFNFVVADDVTGQRILEILQQHGQGRATVLPLNQMKPPHVKYPTNFPPDVCPLIDELQFDERFRPAMQQIFGRVMLCPDLPTARKVLKATRDLDCVTIEGDRVLNTGVMTGGYQDPGRNRIGLSHTIRDLRGKARTLEGELEGLREAEGRVEGEIHKCSLQYTKVEGEMRRARREGEDARGEVHMLNMQRESLQSTVEAEQFSLRQAISEIARLEQQINSQTATLGQPLGYTQSPEEQARLLSLPKELKTLQTTLRKIQRSKVKSESSKDKWKQQMESLQLDIDKLQEAQRCETQVEEQSNLESIVQQLESKRLELARAEGRCVELKKVQQEVKQKLEKLKAEEAEIKDTIKQNTAEMEDRISKVQEISARRQVIQQNMEETKVKIRELGQLPVEAIEGEYQRKSRREANAQLVKVVQSLKQYAHVNKSALDELADDKEQQWQLQRRYQGVEEGKRSLLQLIETTDMRKEEALTRTYKQVAKNFQEVFGALAPGGKGMLVMQKAASHAPPTDPDQADKYIGVKVRVSFGGGETMTMKQLSGGQKSLVALALIFSIQRIDPAPFYIFDEIDAALDEQFRSTLAAMIQRQCGGGGGGGGGASLFQRRFTRSC